MPSLPSALEITQDIVRMDTRNPPGREIECATYLGNLLSDAGIEVEAHEFAKDRTSLVARLKGSGEKPPICFAGHIDVVPLGAKPWSVDPFGAEIIDGKLYGRGTTDMKAGIAAFVHTALKLAGEDRTGQADMVMAICAGEETGCEGSFHLSDIGALGEAGSVVICEPTSNYPLVGHKGALWLRVATTGKTAHGSMPEQGDNAIYKAARSISKLADFDFNIAPHDLLGKSTLNVGMVSGGLNLNSVPDHSEFTVDIRTLPEQDGDKILSGIQSYLGADNLIESLVNVGGIHTPHDDPWIQEVFQIMEGILGEPMEPRGAPYFTDAAALKPAYGDPPTIILGPGEMKMAHQTDEYCPLAHIDQAVEIYETLARRWCAL
jgi:succinyl-diaminopimelate desuccinylase